MFCDPSVQRIDIEIYDPKELGQVCLEPKIQSLYRLRSSALFLNYIFYNQSVFCFLLCLLNTIVILRITRLFISTMNFISLLLFENRALNFISLLSKKFRLFIKERIKTKCFYVFRRCVSY